MANSDATGHKAARLRVGIVGCGAVTQAIHLPALGRMNEIWNVTRVVDIDIEVAEYVAGLVGAAASTDAFALIADPDIDVVAICSPHQFHAEQVIAACEANKKAVLCEKPLCASDAEARAILDASLRAGVPVMAATMHLFDPALAAAFAAWPSGARASYVESTCFLPPNEGFINLATELYVNPSTPPPTAAPVSRAKLFEGGILGLASHHVPLVRRFLPIIEQVIVATTVPPWGYDVTLVGGGTVARMLAVGGSPLPHWSFSVDAPNAQLRVEFPPSYVQAGSARSELRTIDETRSWGFPNSGYVDEWRKLHRVATGREEGGTLADEAVADFLFADRILAGYQDLREVAK